MNFVIYSLIYIQNKFCLHNFKSSKFTATLSWSPLFFPLKNASVFYSAFSLGKIMKTKIVADSKLLEFASHPFRSHSNRRFILYHPNK
jgi:hypothetical protein